MALQPNGCADYTFTSKDIPNLFACDDLFIKRPYWRRSWILQEVLHNRDIIVYIGTQKLPIEDLFALFTKYFSLRKALTSIANTIPMEEQLSPFTKTEEAKEAMSTDSWFRNAGAAESVPDSLVGMRPRFKHPSFEEPRLGALLYTFRDQLAKEPKDKIYSLLGMAKKSTKLRVLYVLLWIESPKRNISSGLGGVELPSWFPDFTHEQQLTPRCLYSAITLFNADNDFPGGLKVVPSSVSEKHGIFTIRGVYIGCITGTHVINVTKKWSEDPSVKDFDQLKLFQYELAPHLSSGSGTTSSDAWPVSASDQLPPTFENTSWGPCMADNGDIIVVMAGCKIPLVLRRYEDNYLFVGGCWLIESQIDLTKLERGTGKQEGFSNIMYGSVVENIGKSCEVEEFDLC